MGRGQFCLPGLAVGVALADLDGQARKTELTTAHEGAAGANRAAEEAQTAVRTSGETMPVELVLRYFATSAAEWTAGTQLATAAHVVASSTANVRYWLPVGAPPPREGQVVTDPTGDVRVGLAPEEPTGPRERMAALDKEQSLQAGLLRCIFGNPFRPVAVVRAWAAWNGRTVARLAQATYDERAFDRMPVLADALEEAGCAKRAFLEHCRGGGPHARGCRVVDALLGKK
jgi:hypothetical protein